MSHAPICVCVCVSAEALQLQSEDLWTKHGRRSAQLEELTRSLERWSNASAKPQGAYLRNKTTRSNSGPSVQLMMSCIKFDKMPQCWLL